MTTGRRGRWAWGYGLLMAAVVVGVNGCADQPGSRTRNAGGTGSSSGPTLPGGGGTSSAPKDRDASTKSNTEAPPVGCPESGLRITAEEPEAAMGLRAMGLTMVNCGDTTRTVTGYPAIRVLGADETELDVAIEPGAASIATIDTLRAEPRPVTLRPGERAISGVAWRNTVTSAAGADPSGHELDVAPLPGQDRQRIPIPGGIDLGDTRRLGVGPWRTPG
ncbi:DUF4232 domain-containing protein (plasmid) [Embleya sp. NBC_00888]|uniref:DUF4232 domain-containing protein n=1 Tax=Embleya sp. NBC_00888 TaxID=2975960 RepID=UPI002F90CE1E|nr:DUF4232 domain-containing protein [Embleya sp. NBC_00888]